MYSKNDFNEEEAVAYEILFSKDTKFEIDLVKKLKEPYSFPAFTETVLEYLKHAGLNVTEDEMFLHKKKMLWIIHIKR